MLRIVTALSLAGSAAGIVDATTAGEKPEGVTATGMVLLISGCVCCILIVAFGRPAFAPSGGSVIRAVSFFGTADTATVSGIPAARAAGAGVGFKGTVGREPSDGGLGGGVMPLIGFGGGSGAPPCEGGLGGAGTKGFGAEGGAWGT